MSRIVVGVDGSAEPIRAVKLVLDSRGLGGFRGLLLGSVSQQVVQHAHCPTVVVPHEAAGE